jgi:hypothetical protein
MITSERWRRRKQGKLGSARVVRTRQSSAGENETVGTIQDHSRSVLHNTKPSSHIEKKKQIQREGRMDGYIKGLQNERG